MAKRELHSWVLLMGFSYMLPNMQFVMIILAMFYYLALFSDLCFYLNVPLLTVIRNVYCDGVFDLCHIGHKKLFRR